MAAVKEAATRFHPPVATLGRISQSVHSAGNFPSVGLCGGRTRPQTLAPDARMRTSERCFALS